MLLLVRLSPPKYNNWKCNNFGRQAKPAASAMGEGTARRCTTRSPVPPCVVSRSSPSIAASPPASPGARSTTSSRPSPRSSRSASPPGYLARSTTSSRPCSRSSRSASPRSPGYLERSTISSRPSSRAMSGSPRSQRRLDRPGPGSYEVPDHLLTGVTSSFNQYSRSGSSGFTYSSPQRSALASTHSYCDPGQYTIDAGRSGASTGKAEALSARSMRSHNVHATRGRGSFNSVVQRPQSAPRSSAGGGPGSYDTGHLFECGRTATAVASPFRSILPANMHVPKSETPGVGTYELSAGMGTPRPSPSPGSASFKGPERRTAMPTTSNPGPGSYDLSSGKRAHTPACSLY